MSHQRSQSTSSILNELGNSSSYTNKNTTKTAPLSISLPRQRSMSTSFGFSGPPSSSATPTSPISSFSASSSINPNPFLNPIISPSSGSSSGGGGSGGGSNATPSSTLASLSSSTPSLNRRFSANFTNPLTTTANMGTSSASIDDRGRRQSLFGSSPPLARHHTDIHEPTFTTNTTTYAHNSTETGGGGGGGGGIGGLFRKFSVSGRSGNHPLDRNEPGPASSHDIPNTHQGPTAPMAHIKAVDALKPPAQKDQISRSSSPMRNMILNGQMLD